MSSSAAFRSGGPEKARHTTRWQRIPWAGPEQIMVLISRLYWMGINRDLDDILRTLHVWRNAAAPSPSMTEPEDWLGFESFAKRATGTDSFDQWVP
jgi:hypothetical protein